MLLIAECIGQKVAAPDCLTKITTTMNLERPSVLICKPVLFPSKVIASLLIAMELLAISLGARTETKSADPLTISFMVPNLSILQSPMVLLILLLEINNT